MSLRAIVLLLLVGLIWGASFLFIRVAVEEVQPLQIVFVRTASGALAMLAFLRARRRPLDIERHNLVLSAGLAVLAILAPFFLIAWSEKEIESGTAAVLNATVPLFTLFFAAVALEEERLTLPRILGVLLGLAGVVILVGGEVDGHAGALSLAALLLASACYGLAAVGGRILVQRWNPLSLSTAMVCFSALYSAVLFFATGDLRLDISIEAWLSMLLLGAVGTGIAYILYYTLIDLVSSVRASFVAYVIPIVGVVLGALVLDESVGWSMLLGGAVILAGIAIGTGALHTRPSSAPQTETAAR